MISQGPCPAIDLPTSHAAQISVIVSQLMFRILLIWKRLARFVPGPLKGLLYVVEFRRTTGPGKSEAGPA